ncbi:MAG: glycosyltransferase family A protein [Candidatus Neomarinimicrobiota bacterium]
MKKSDGKVSISVIIPVYNSARFIHDTINNILKQSMTPFEIIVIDDGSTDGSGELVKTTYPDIQYRYQNNQGPAAARNAGLKIARGNAIAFQDSDDLWPKNKLELQAAYLNQNPAVDIILGQTQVYVQRSNSSGEKIYVKFKDPWPALMFHSALIRKGVFETAGFIDETFQYAEEVDWFLRAKEIGVDIRFIKETVLFYHRHQDNMSKLIRSDKKYFITALKKSLSRRRARSNSGAREMPSWLSGKKD